MACPPLTLEDTRPIRVEKGRFSGGVESEENFSAIAHIKINNSLEFESLLEWKSPECLIIDIETTGVEERNKKFQFESFSFFFGSEVVWRDDEKGMEKHIRHENHRSSGKNFFSLFVYLEKKRVLREDLV